MSNCTDIQELPPPSKTGADYLIADAAVELVTHD